MSMNLARFDLGQIVSHRRFHYRGVIFGVDPCFSLDDQWYETMATSRPPKDRPWYHVLVDGTDRTTYVAERNLAPCDDHQQIQHPRLGDCFNRYDGDRYYIRATTQ
ncbi:heat shock protein HspQ [Aestuariirhabdus litorea]|nr:heat shock protein HspQ [Aestuariirhabdus litorea]